MKKICVFTQTYSDNRAELFHYHNKDESDINFRNQFDATLYSFHNSSDIYVNSLLDSSYFKQLKNLKIARYNNISYTESFQHTLDWVVKNNYDYFVFLQDDCLTAQNIDLDLINFIKNEQFDMLNLETTPNDLNVFKNYIYSKNTFGVTDTKSSDFVNRGWYAFDDGAYVAKVDFLVSALYDKAYFDQSDVWSGEIYLEQKIKTTPIQRFTTNKNYYSRYNILGRNAWDRINLLTKLKTRFTQ